MLARERNYNMSFASRNNSGSRFNVDTKGFPFVKLTDLDLETTYPIQGFYINSKGDFEPHPVFILKDKLVDMPQHLTEKCREIQGRDEDVMDIVAGKVGFKVREYVDRKGKTRRTIDWVDL